MRFYGYFRSSAAFRCRIAFALKGLAPETVFVHLRKGEQRLPAFLERNPHGLLPALESDGKVLTQSLAIIEWLDEVWPTPPLLPGDAFRRAEVRAIALSIACDTHPLQNLRVLNHVRDTFAQDQQGVFGFARHFIALGLGALEKQLALTVGEGRFCVGETPTLADICLVPQMVSAERFGVDTTALPTLRRIHAHCMTIPAFAEAHPTRQPDAEP